MDDIWFGYYSRNTTTEILYSSYGKPYETAVGLARRIAVKIDISDIPPGTPILKANYILPLSSKIYPLNSNSYDDGLSLYRILDPSGTGNWDTSSMNSRYKRQENDGEWISWTDNGGTFADCIDPPLLIRCTVLSEDPSSFMLLISPILSGTGWIHRIQTWDSVLTIRLFQTVPKTPTSDRILKLLLNPHLHRHLFR